MNILFHFNKVYCSLFNYGQRIFYTPIKVLDNFQSLKLILDKGVSISRFGDGEIRLMNSESIEFQEYDNLLTSRLIAIVSSNVANHMVCLPMVFGSLGAFTAPEKYFWKKHLISYRQIWIKYVDLKRVYLSAQLTRPWMPFLNKADSKSYFECFKLMWAGRPIIIVEGLQTRFGVRNNLLANCTAIQRILCPIKNAFSSYDRILEAVNISYKDQLVLVALGPTATVLCYDLSMRGIQAIDIGHLDIEYEWFLSKSFSKIEIKGKYTNEAVYDKGNIEDILDSAYVDQIIKVINK